MNGKITRFFHDRKFGFVRDEESVDHFFHADDVIDDFEPQPGKHVTFNLGSYKGREKAISIKLRPKQEPVTVANAPTPTTPTGSDAATTPSYDDASEVLREVLGGSDRGGAK